MITLNLIQPRIRVNDKPIKIYQDSEGKKWIEARKNTKFAIEVKNNSACKILAVISVDGLNIINGERAEIKPKNGYTIAPYSNIIVSGWRISMDEVKEFIFTDKGESYVSKLTGDSKNTGVIGFAFFDITEKKETEYHYYFHYVPYYYIPIYPWPYYYPYKPAEWWSTSKTIDNTNWMPASTTLSLNVSNSVQCYNTSCDIGTGMGDKKVEKALETPITTGPVFMYQDAIYYASREKLIEMGIIKTDSGKLPEPFEPTGFCPEI